MKKIALEFLRVKELSTGFDFQKLENQNNIFLPPVFKLFLNTYELSSTGLIEGENVWNSSYNGKWALGTFSYIPFKNLILYNFIEIFEISNIMSNMFDKSDEIWDMQVIPIAECFGQELLMLGIGKENQDRIYLETNKPFDSDIKNRLMPICNNIFEFFQNLQWEIDEGMFPLGLNSTSQLYRNWGEDFWRVRGDNIAT
jgi:hypothetical protein